MAIFGGKLSEEVSLLTSAAPVGLSVFVCHCLIDLYFVRFLLYVKLCYLM